MAKRSGDGQSGMRTPVERVAGVTKDARRLDASGAPMAGPVCEILAQALAFASRAGFTRDLVAQRLGISVRTLKAYTEIESNARVHADTLVRMVRDRAVLGAEAAEYLALELSREMGLTGVMVMAATDNRDPAEQFLEISQWNGELARRIAEAGGEIDADEKRDIRECAREQIRQLTELVESLGGRK